ncbi:Uncharacterised protein [Vibrio cholerae]|uniref:Uncharacterized protein n=1 Tax=Vibrio cholerae TaxID=666 RepID=A0A655R5S5_VIBCL|nr:Uncharacterised protein [Vibrio cholerae]CSA86272.1 Uncharacterised protein [Vibrio cholerae]CSB13382.1 Uncharacterised protein [Vibrio cholerae]CSC54084.1 Uncharacterised protein [Vibrio cholerae]CSC55492.1 Uncharacterised protein [Vibrio cholerae]
MCGFVFSGANAGKRVRHGVELLGHYRVSLGRIYRYAMGFLGSSRLGRRYRDSQKEPEFSHQFHEQGYVQRLNYCRKAREYPLDLNVPVLRLGRGEI